ncbi:cobyrinate a,c-diamide synthase [Breoghania sp. L-A4]|uniref:cobyrinate a,c-diamide synthase n=1 Tax=Breoghania sp. L-A4 TaxID=2304600 RepID=UPI000E360585|nr:cobyrinate a,c-diamide synthase [Breoghania sp. L-A4]AXS39140.1 cobyrinate a,c-diamide synthase [Breoghania sp. L-A4]
MSAQTGNARALVMAAPASGSGKTVLTLALLRAYARAGRKVASAKAGPDYIDPRYHEAASGAPCVNLDAWGMGEGTLFDLAGRQARGRDLLIIEGVMGLFDGAADGSGTTADLAMTLDAPVVLVVDAAKQAQSVGALVRGFRDHRPGLTLAGVLLNRIGSTRHEAMLRGALEDIGVEVLGAVPRSQALSLPERHLGLVQAGEHADLEGFLEAAADAVDAALDLDRLAEVARPLAKPAPSTLPRSERGHGLAPLGQRIAIARDDAFAFAYPHLLDGWRRAGAELTFFSPLADEPPAEDADAIYLPGGYPELHAGRIAAARTFLSRLCMAARARTRVYGECGGYMVLGEGLVDAEGARHAMAGLLPLETSFASRKLHLGYRRLTPLGSVAPWAHPLSAHEFHYASILREGTDGRETERLFAATDAQGQYLGTIGLRAGTVMGSFAHVIAQAG